MNASLLFCDFARVTNEGHRFDSIGAGLNKIHATRFPTPVSFSLLVEAKFTESEIGNTYPFEIKIIDPKGVEVGGGGKGIKGFVTVSNIEDLTSFAAFNMQFIIQQKVDFKFILTLDGKMISETILSIDLRESKSIKKTKKK